MNLRHVKQESLAWQDMSQLRKPLGSEIWKEKREMIKTQHPWQLGPTELIDFALERMYKGSDFDRRLAFLILDVGVETLFKTYLTLPDGVTQFQIKRGDRLAASEGNFHELLRGVQNSNPKKAAGLNFPYVEYYHNLRNTLYHQGNQVGRRKQGLLGACQGKAERHHGRLYSSWLCGIVPFQGHAIRQRRRRSERKAKCITTIKRTN